MYSYLETSNMKYFDGVLITGVTKESDFYTIFDSFDIERVLFNGPLSTEIVH
jgi:hypothetical protein